jgi:hypothetical protein
MHYRTGFRWDLLRPALLVLIFGILALPAWPQESGQIVIGSQASTMEVYAAKELQRCAYQLSGQWLGIVRDEPSTRAGFFVLGQRHTHPLLGKLAAAGYHLARAGDPGPEGYVLKKLVYGSQPAIAIAGGDELGCLYGVYGLLAEHYQVGFFLTGDVFPDKKAPLAWVEVDERKTPTMPIRGLLPWSNFPQSSTSYSWEDWRFLIDQMARMRLNFLNLHNYSGERGYNEVFAPFTVNGFTARPALATARTGHVWHGPSWEPRQYRFQAGDLFDDYDFGSDAALHNETLTSEAVGRKGVCLFQRIIAYAHTRGIRVGLGLDIDLIPAGYQLKANDPGIIRARVEQLATDYPDLDFLICFQSEEANKDGPFQQTWRAIFMEFYAQMKQRAPSTRLAVSGWGLSPQFVAAVPRDVICAPIAKYSDQFESGAAYGSREYWGCPWLERDQVSSQYYYPYNVHLSRTVAAYRDRAPNMKGFYGLTWRLGDAIEPKLSYLSKAPWDTEGRWSSAQAVYREYAALSYGAAAAAELGDIINENEPFASDFAECQGTAAFVPQKPRGGFLFRSGPEAERSKCARQLRVVDQWLARTDTPSHRAHLELLRARLVGVQDHLVLNNQFERYQWADLPGAMEPWARSFMRRVSDISSLGNIVSVQNRFVQIRYLVKENTLRQQPAVRAPSRVEARGTREGALITWTHEEPKPSGFNVFRNGLKLNPAPLPGTARSYVDRVGGTFRYSVSALETDHRESPLSVPCSCDAGNADKSPPQVVVISPPTSIRAGQPASIKARVIDGRAYDCISATLHYRAPGAAEWKKLPMERRVKAVFGVRIPAGEIADTGVEYFVQCSDGSNLGRFPVSAPALALFVTSDSPAAAPPPKTAGKVRVTGQMISWSAAGNHAYCLYRSKDPQFQPGPATFLTCVAGDTACFRDAAEDYDGLKLSGNRYYRITAQDKAGYESAPTDAVCVVYP